MKNERLNYFLLRSGLAIVFLYASVDAFSDASSWIGFVPQWVQAIIPGMLFLTLFAAGEAVLAVWLLSGQKPFIASMISNIILLLIIIINVAVLDILFRDVAILFASLALTALSYEKLNAKT